MQPQSDQSVTAGSQNEFERAGDRKPAREAGVTIGIDRTPNAEWKALGGGDRDQWNERLSNLVTRALPVNQRNAELVSKAGSAVAAGVVDMNPADPIEGILISQIAVLNEAALELYRRAWACDPADYFEAHMKYLQAADKASRTVAILTEQLDRHRGRGQQQILIKHITVNADQAVVTDTVMTGQNNEATTAAKLVAATTEKPMEIIEPVQKEAVPMVGGGSKTK
jgi:hypothetical protein